MATRYQPMLELEVVFDDPVLNDRDLAAGIAVRVGVLLSHRAVGGPARVADPARPTGGLLAQMRYQVGQLADTAAQLHAFAVVDRDPGRIIAAIFQAPQT